MTVIRRMLKILHDPQHLIPWEVWYYSILKSCRNFRINSTSQNVQTREGHQALITVINNKHNNRNTKNTSNKKYTSNSSHIIMVVPTYFSAWLTTLQNSAISTPTNDSCGAIRLTKTLLGLSREYGNTFYRGYIGILLPCSLLRTSKKDCMLAKASVVPQKRGSAPEIAK